MNFFNRQERVSKIETRGNFKGFCNNLFSTAAQFVKNCNFFGRRDEQKERKIETSLEKEFSQKLGLRKPQPETESHSSEETSLEAEFAKYSQPLIQKEGVQKDFMAFIKRRNYPKSQLLDSLSIADMVTRFWKTSGMELQDILQALNGYTIDIKNYEYVKDGKIWPIREKQQLMGIYKISSVTFRTKLETIRGESQITMEIFYTGEDYIKKTDGGEPYAATVIQAEQGMGVFSIPIREKVPASF